MHLTGPKLGLNLQTTGTAHITLYRTWSPTDLFTGPHGQVTRVSQCQKKSSSRLYGAREDNRGTHTDQPDGRHTIQINQRPTSITPHFYAGCPSCRTATTLSSLGTGTKHAGLHTQWCCGYIDKANLTKWLLLVRITDNQRLLFMATIQVNLYLSANNPS